MRYAIIADIHANLAAFAAVLADMEQRGGVEEIWCLGDIVGYGPEPRKCLELLQRYRHVSVVGNHDLAAIGRVDTVYFNPDAAAACRWTARQLKPEDVNYLEGLPVTMEREGFTLVHGSPREPLWEYVISNSIALRNFAFFRSSYCLVGHSHVPAVFKYEDGSATSARPSPNVGLALGGTRLIINPGSVGQPRDGDPQAGYAIYDSEGPMVRLYRVPYDIGATQDKMLEVGLPIHLVSRLQDGL